MNHDIFISYSSHDQEFANKICAALEDKNIKCWIAPRDITGGMKYTEALLRGVHSSKIFLLLLSSYSNASRHVEREIECADHSNKRIIPLVLEKISLSQHFEYFLAGTHMLHIDALSIEKSIDKIIATICYHLLCLAELKKSKQSEINSDIEYDKASQEKIDKLLGVKTDHQTQLFNMQNYAVLSKEEHLILPNLNKSIELWKKEKEDEVSKLKNMKDEMELLQKEERIYRDHEIKDKLQENLGKQAIILKICGDLDQALDRLREKERICNTLGNKKQIRWSIFNQALIYKERGILRLALRYFMKEAKICRELCNMDALQNCLGNIASILFDLNDLDHSIIHLKEKESICRSQKNKVGLRMALSKQALIYRIKGDYRIALDYYEAEESICRQLGNTAGVEKALANQALIFKEIRATEKSK